MQDSVFVIEDTFSLPSSEVQPPFEMAHSRHWIVPSATTEQGGEHEVFYLASSMEELCKAKNNK